MESSALKQDHESRVKIFIAQSAALDASSATILRASSTCLTVLEYACCASLRRLDIFRYHPPKCYAASVSFAVFPHLYAERGVYLDAIRPTKHVAVLNPFSLTQSQRVAPELPFTALPLRWSSMWIELRLRTWTITAKGYLGKQRERLGQHHVHLQLFIGKGMHVFRMLGVSWQLCAHLQ